MRAQVLSGQGSFRPHSSSLTVADCGEGTPCWYRNEPMQPHLGGHKVSRSKGPSWDSSTGQPRGNLTENSSEGGDDGVSLCEVFSAWSAICFLLLACCGCSAVLGGSQRLLLIWQLGSRGIGAFTSNRQPKPTETKHLLDCLRCFALARSGPNRRGAFATICNSRDRKF